MASRDRVVVELQGALELARALEKLPDKIAKRAADRGIRRTAVELRREFRAAAPVRTGHLRSAITYRFSSRTGVAKVGLGQSGKAFAGRNGRRGIPFYYKTLEFRTARGPALNPFFLRTWNRVKSNAARRLLKETKEAVFFEAGREYARSRARLRRIR